MRGPKVGVDPFPAFDASNLGRGARFHRKTSRDYFQSNPLTKFDVIFLDGLHTFEETYLDLVGAVSALGERGVILIDDVFPTDEPSSLPSQAASTERKTDLGIDHKRWYGDVWRLAFFLLHGSASAHFTCLVIGDGKLEHSQLLVRPKPLSRWNPDADADLAEMSLYEFADEVMGQAASIARSAQSEKTALYLAKSVFR